MTSPSPEYGKGQDKTLEATAGAVAGSRPRWYMPPLEHAPSSGCLNCGPKPLRVKLNARLHAGFGSTALLRDGEHVESYYDYEKCPTFRRFENIAAKDPDHDWRVQVDGPLSDVTYQRHGRNEWVAVERGLGFA